jgi:hypothetical protein
MCIQVYHVFHIVWEQRILAEIYLQGFKWLGDHRLNCGKYIRQEAPSLLRGYNYKIYSTLKEGLATL